MWENRVLFLDGEALVIDKPAGLAVHPGLRGGRSLEDHLHQLSFGFARLPQPVHRLDQDTTGCLLLARNPKAQRRFQRAFEDRQVEKAYLAVLEGVPEGDEGVIDMALDKISSAAEGWRMVPRETGKAAVTRWRLIARQGARSLIRFEPETGRTHQIRVHALHGLGAAVAGDPVYGDGAGPMLLHAQAIKVQRAGKAPIEAEAPLPQSFLEAGFGDAG
jgi:tRNA pseudouridine32 synthase/23S rRNA pseudouridine746 synthase